MKNIYGLILFFLLCTSVELNAQNAKLEGLLLDSLGTPLPSATVVLLHPRDSVMEYFAITDAKGLFKIKAIADGDYIFQASYVGYQSFYKNISVKGLDQHLGAIVLQNEQIYLDAATVTAERIPILIKKDTVEYNASSFRTQPNDVVEDLLKQLPGVEVDKDGTIRAQGQEVDQITVDGKTFFGDDPAIASQNLPADAVDKVQVFDRKSEVAQFTGIDDGQQNKSINLKLKEDKKKGVFGNVTAGYGSDERYLGKATVNRFNQKSQLSFLGRANNINRQGFSFNDYINFSGGLQNLMGDGGGLELRIDGDEGLIPFDFGQANYGFTNTFSGGVNFNYDFSKKTEFRSSYFGSHVKKIEDKSIFRQNFLEGLVFPSEEISKQEATNLNHRINTSIEHKIDSSQIVRFNANLNLNQSEFDRLLRTNTFNVQEQLENSGYNDELADGNDLGFASSLRHMWRLKKTGRSLVTSVGFGGDFDQNDQEISAINQFNLTDPDLTLSDSLDQIQNRENEQLEYNLRLTYTEPIRRGVYAQFNYNRRSYTDESIREIYDQVSGQKIFNELLSNHFIRDYRYDRLGLTIRNNKKKANLSLGLNWQLTELNGELVSEKNRFNRVFKAWLPFMNWQYNISNSKNLRLDYATTLEAPDVRQLQPFVDNTNPLSVYVGNPDLEPEYRHRMNLRFMWYDQFSFTNIFANIGGVYTKNKITNSRTIDAQLRQTTTPLNVKNDLLLNANISFGTPLRFMKAQINLDFGGQYNRGILFVNTIQNNTDRWNTSLDFNIGNRKKKVLDALAGFNWTFNKTKYDVNQDFDQTFHSMNYYTDIRFNLKKGWNIGSTFDYTLYRGASLGNQRAVPMWKASISKSFLKNDRGTLELKAADLLNQGIGINRNSSFNYIEDVRINSLGRYIMLSFTYALNAFGDQGMGGIQIKSSRR